MVGHLCLPTLFSTKEFLFKKKTWFFFNFYLGSELIYSLNSCFMMKKSIIKTFDGGTLISIENVVNIFFSKKLRLPSFTCVIWHAYKVRLIYKKTSKAKTSISPINKCMAPGPTGLTHFISVDSWLSSIPDLPVSVSWFVMMLNSIE